jgi:hypothetical protein
MAFSVRPRNLSEPAILLNLLFRPLPVNAMTLSARFSLGGVFFEDFAV